MKTITLPWGAWYGDQMKTMELPATWDPEIFTLESDYKLPASSISEKLLPLMKDLNDRKPGSIVVVVDDLTRPVMLDILMDELLAIFRHVHLNLDGIRILIGLGTHRPLDKDQVRKKLGERVLEQIEWINHHPDDTIPVDITWGKTPVHLNRHYVNADYKIVISGLTPHSFAGFSGGAKMLYPGLADMETIAKTHKSVLMGFMGQLGDTDANRFRQTIEDFVPSVGLDMFIGVVINGDRSIRNIHVGDYRQAHRQAAKEARQYYLQRTIVQKPEPYDAVLLNAYPKDTELLQIENALIPLKSSKKLLVKEGGTVIVTSACSEGMGGHGLFEPGGKLYRRPRPQPLLKKYQVCMYAESIPESDFYKLFPPDYMFFNQLEPMMKALRDLIPQAGQLAVFPYGSLQLTG